MSASGAAAARQRERLFSGNLISGVCQHSLPDICPQKKTYRLPTNLTNTEIREYVDTYAFMKSVMPQIEISNQTFERLQAIAKPFIDTPGSVIDRLLDRYDVLSKSSEFTIKEEVLPTRPMVFDPGQPPDLTHTKLTRAAFGVNDLQRVNWAELVRVAHETAYASVQDFAHLRQLSSAHLVKGKKEDEGFTPMRGMDFSIQGVDTNGAWKIAYGLARKLGVSIEAHFEWREKEGSMHPGQAGTLKWKPSTRLPS